LAAVDLDCAGVRLHFVVMRSYPRCLSICGQIGVFFAGQHFIDDRAAQERRAGLGNGRVLLAGGAVVDRANGFFGGGIGFAVAIERVMLLHGEGGDGFGAAQDDVIDALDDLLGREGGAGGFGLGWGLS